MTEHYNGLTEAEHERLALLMEECAEVIQVIGKILRHGYPSDNNGKLPQVNRVALMLELGDMYHAMLLMHKAKDISIDEVISYGVARDKSKYLHHQ